MVVAISQSGETADTLAALREAKEKGALALGVVNVVGSHDRPRNRRRHLPARRPGNRRRQHQGVHLPVRGADDARALHRPPAVHEPGAVPGDDRRPVRDPRSDGAGARAERRRSRTSPSEFCDRENWLFLGRGYHYPVALEGALKLKEISYIHAEGMPAAEMKHGPIALINEGMPVVFIATQGHAVRQGHQQHRRSPRPRRHDHRRRHRRRHAHPAATATTSSTSPTRSSRCSRC